MHRVLISLTFVGMVTAMDEAIGNISLALKAAGMYDDTVIVFTSDVRPH